MSAERQKGTYFVTSLLPELRRYYPRADAAALHGALDIGDVVLPDEDRFILEMKNRKELDLSTWLREAKVEAENFRAKWELDDQPAAVVVHKRRGTTDPKAQYVTLLLGDFLWLVNGDR